MAKAGTDKMAADMAVATADPGKFGHVLDNAETPELTGHIIPATSSGSCTTTPI